LPKIPVARQGKNFNKFVALLKPWFSLLPLRIWTNKAKSCHALQRDGFSGIQGASVKRCPNVGV
jgi:hypothetical protein